MVKKVTNFMQPVFAGTSCDQRLQTIIETKTHHRKYEIIHTGNACNCKRLLTKTAKKNIVGNKIYLRHKNRHSNRHCNFQDLPVAYFNL